MLKIVLTHVASGYTKKPFMWEISSTPTELVRNTNIAAILMFWNTNRANVTSCKKALKFVGRLVGPDGSFSLDYSSVKTRQNWNVSVHIFVYITLVNV